MGDVRDGEQGPRSMSRRAVIRAGLAGLAGLALHGCGGSTSQGGGGPYGSGTISGGTLTLDLSQPANAPLQAIDGTLFVQTPSDILIVVRTATAEAIALSAICTHAGCIVGFDATSRSLPCPCHGSLFAESGAVQRGPASAPLRAYAASVNGQQIAISLA